MSSAFLIVFGLVGVVLSAGLSTALVAAWLPWVAIAVGVGVAGLGVAVLRGFELTVALPRPQAGTRGRGIGQVFLFGGSYALASLSCTLPVFLAVVAGTLTRVDFFSGVVTFLAYGLGMSTMVVSVVVALALARQQLVLRLKRAVRHLHWISGTLLVVAGVYVVYFWVFTLATGWTGQDASGAIPFVEQLSARATNLVGAAGPGIGLLLLAVVLTAVAWRLLAASPGDRGDVGDRHRDEPSHPAPARRR